MKKIAIVILNFNGTKDTIECLESINKLSAADIAFSVIIDNGSKEKFKVESSKLKVGDINIIRSEENLGFAGGNNIGIKYALKNGADYIFILNNDTILDKNLIKELLVVMESDEKIGVVVPKIYFCNYLFL
ncbi:MAG: glycosyltransferase family 2 protein, partial [Patescibacteria group bacterium]|nr:glycosyltransferase family 2 protein [Patescibacteria group bacterium]